MSTYIDGIAASENIDSSGERIIIAGLDCSSLEKDGVFNYEHKNDQPSQVVGKILKAKKIFSEKDAEDDRQLYYFKKCGVPYLYVMGELFDDYKDSARDIAGMFRYDADKKGKNERNVMNFSIEGAKIDKQGMDIPRSIARKVTITVLPCNKAAVAEMVPTAAKKPKDSLDNIFKTETGIEIELFKPHAGAELFVMNKAETANPKGTVLGRTGSGKNVFSHGRVGDYSGFSSLDHRDASEMHMVAGRKSNDGKLNAHHTGKANLHMQAAGTAEKRETRSAAAGPMKSVVKPSTQHKFVDIPGKRTSMGKAETAGSGMGAPSTLTGTAALAKEDLKKPMKMEVPHPGKFKDPEFTRKDKAVDAAGNRFDRNPHPKNKAALEDALADRESHINANPKLKEHLNKLNTHMNSKWGGNRPMRKSQMLQRAEEAYSKWEKREEFEKFMAKKLPGLARGEIKAIGQTMALKKSMDAEQSLAKMAGMTKALTFGDGKPHTPSKEDGSPAKLPAKFHNYKSDVKGSFDSEVEHAHPHYDGKSADTIYLKSGHKLEGHPKGKFKTGDKVSVKQHVMGTHLMEHKKV